MEGKKPERKYDFKKHYLSHFELWNIGLNAFG